MNSPDTFLEAADGGTHHQCQCQALRAQLAARNQLIEEMARKLLSDAYTLRCFRMTMAAYESEQLYEKALEALDR
ncbi:MAG: hypothetical protein JO069_00365 [Verrucomicrobia bacterium]|nr:hypothetical protein [Verrucomicrobiota bacterium]